MSREHIRRNWACLKDKMSARRAQYRKPPVCPKCREEMALMPFRMQMPSRKSGGWAKARVVVTSKITGHTQRHIEWPRD